MQNTFRLRWNWLFIVFLAMGVTFFVGCNERRSEGKKPVVVEDDEVREKSGGGFFGQQTDRGPPPIPRVINTLGSRISFQEALNPTTTKRKSSSISSLITP